MVRTASSRSNRESGSILLYCVVALVFLAGVTVVLSRLSDPVIFTSSEPADTVRREALAKSGLNVVLSQLTADPETLTQREREAADAFRTRIADTFNARAADNRLLVRITSDNDEFIGQVNVHTLKTDDILINSDMRIVRLELTYAVRLSTDPAFSSSRTVTRLLAYDDAVSSPAL